MLTELKNAAKVVGIKQLRRALKENTCTKVFLAENAESRITAPIVQQCEQSGVAVEWVPTMRELGQACEIEVGAAAAGILH
jgi:large subunit ribosomal protein L7A